MSALLPVLFPLVWATACIALAWAISIHERNR